MEDLKIDVAEYFINNGLPYVIGDSMIFDYTPDTPDNIMVISEYNGPPTTTGVESLDRRLQIKVRDAKYSVARKNIWQCFVLVDKPKDRIINYTDKRWSVSWAKQTPALLERDSQGRSVFVFNLAVTTYGDYKGVV